jgi:hypothetical protein
MRIFVEERHDAERESRRHHGGVLGHPPRGDQRERPQHHQCQRHAEGPRGQHEAQRGLQLAAAEPVGHHPRQHDVHQDPADAGQGAPERGAPEPARVGDEHAAGDHQPEAGDDDALAAEALAQQATR